MPQRPPTDHVLELKRALRQREKELEILTRLSEQISRTLDLEDLLKQIVNIVADTTGADACLLYLLDGSRRELVLRASRNPHPRLIGRITLGVGEGITGWVAKERTPVAITQRAADDPRFRFFHNLPEDRYQAFLSVPIIRKTQVIGVINLQHKRPHRHARNEIALVVAVANQVGGAIETARLFEERKKRLLQIETLSQVSKMIVSNRYLEEILQLIVTMTAEMMGSKICSIMLVNEERQVLEIVATQSLSQAYRKKPPPKLGESISGLVVKERTPIAVLDVRKDPRYQFQELARQEGLCSLLSVPMMVKDRAVGVINSYTSHEHEFDEGEIQILQAVANQAAVAIENTRLLQQRLEMEEALETRKVVERAKGYLMHEAKLSEAEAFRFLQRQSMNTRKSMREVAEAVLLAQAIKNP